MSKEESPSNTELLQKSPIPLAKNSKNSKKFALLHTNIMGNLPAPIRSKLFNRYGNEHYQVCVCAMQGYRSNMEDAHSVHLSFTNHKEYSLFGIFDGHNGRKAAEYLSNNLYNKLNSLTDLSHNIDIQNTILTLDKEFCNSQYGEHGSTIVFALIKPIYYTLDELNNKNNDNSDDKKSKEPSITSLSSSKTESIHDLSDIISKYFVRIFWAGDSRAILISSDASNPNKLSSIRCLTTDHRPDNPSENLRIREAKGIIMNNRVDSKLAVSRAFGDCNLKNNNNLSFSKQRVTSLTEITECYANIGDRLFLFCDGLVEYFNNNELILSLYKYLPSYEDPVYALGYLFDEILEGGSRDNMSGILCYFNNNKNGINYGINNKSRTFLPGPLYLSRNDKKYVDAYMKNAKLFGHYDSYILRRAAYREDIKYLKKFSLNKNILSQIGKSQNNIINEIQCVIKQIDEIETDKNKVSSMQQQSPLPLTQGDHDDMHIIKGGSTEVIDDDDYDDQVSSSDTSISSNNSNSNHILNKKRKKKLKRKRRSTPPLSDDDDIEEEDEIDNDDNNNKATLSDRNITSIMQPLKRYNSIVINATPSPKHSINNNGHQINSKQTPNEIKENVSPIPVIVNKIQKLSSLTINDNDDNNINNRKRSLSTMINDDNDDNKIQLNNNNGNNNNNNTNNDNLIQLNNVIAAKRRKSNTGDYVEIRK